MWEVINQACDLSKGVCVCVSVTASQGRGAEIVSMYILHNLSFSISLSPSSFVGSSCVIPFVFTKLAYFQEYYSLSE